MRKAAALIALVLWAGLVLPLDTTQGAPATSAWDYLLELIMIPGISGQEGKVMDFIQSRLPKGLAVQRDSKNNFWFTAGKGRPHLLFVAHADELGFTVGEITLQGTVKLKGRGGFLPLVCEARPFVIHTAKGPVEGIVIPRPDLYSQNPQPFAPEGYELDVGASSDKEARELGIAPGDQVIFKKAIIDLAPGIMATRAVDDRAGCAALLAAAAELDWSGLKGRTVTFAWSVEEEIGLNGARAMAEVLKPDYVFAVDTFVSTDSPLENKRFGFARLGHGAVLRAIDSSNITPQALLRRVIELSEQKKIPIQARNTRGGNDGSEFVAGGAADIPLSWPGVNAHSFIEKIDRRDLDALTALIKALATDFE
jgi:putative aminopeptidase FrvX